MVRSLNRVPRSYLADTDPVQPVLVFWGRALVRYWTRGTCSIKRPLIKCRQRSYGLEMSADAT
jgi:hypothetical protein